MDKEKTFQLSLDFEGKHYDGTITPSTEVAANGMPVYFRVVLGDQFFAYLCCADNGWGVRDGEDRSNGLVNAIGDYIAEYYE
jgi:hypothetical protein